MQNKKRNVAVIGANGQLGSELIKVLSQDDTIQLFPLTHSDIEITKDEETKRVLDLVNPDIVINTAAFHKVDDCEKNTDKAFLVNAFAQKKIAEYCQKKNATSVFISTDHVFGLNREKKTPYKETDFPGPLNVYGVSKLSGEYFTKYSCEKHFVIRSGGLFGSTPSSIKGENFVESIISLAKKGHEIRVVNDQILSPTYTNNLARQIHQLLSTNYHGTYHATAQGECSWFDFAKEVFNLIKFQAKLIPVTSKEYYTNIKRPQYCVLENAALKETNLDIMLDWKVGLIEYLKEKKHLHL